MSILLWTTITILLATIVILLSMFTVAYLLTNSWQQTSLILQITIYSLLFPKKRLANYQASRNQTLLEQGNKIIKTDSKILMQQRKFKNLKMTNRYKNDIKKLIDSGSYKISSKRAQHELNHLGLNHFFTAYNIYLKAILNLTPEQMKALDLDPNVESKPAKPVLNSLTAHQAHRDLKTPNTNHRHQPA